MVEVCSLVVDGLDVEFGESLTTAKIQNNTAALEALRIASNMDQIEASAPPPNPAKLTDSRATEYIRKYGRESWELDALEPKVLTALIDTHVKQYRDESAYKSVLAKEERERAFLDDLGENWLEVYENWGEIKEEYC